MRLSFMLRSAPGFSRANRLTMIAWALFGTCAAQLPAQEPQSGATRNETNDTPAAADPAKRQSKADVESSAIDELPWEVRPYRLLISIAVDGSPALSTRFHQQLTQTLRTRIAGVMGDYWQPKFEANRWLLPTSRSALQRLGAEVLSARFSATDLDKVMILTIEDKGGLQLSGCEWDRSTGELGPVFQRDVIDRRRVADVALELMLELFRPLARIDAAEGGMAELRARGGELLAPESLSVTFQECDFLVPYFRYLNRDKEVRSIQSVPWTYLRVDDINRSRLTAGVETAFNAPLAGSRRRVELIAIRASPSFGSTRLRLAPRNNPARPLVGVRVRVYEQLPTEEQPNPEMVELMTDRSGRVDIPASPRAPLRRLLVHSGGAVLSNVPFLPGLAVNVSMELPDDSPRLAAEGSLAIVQGELIDLVSRRTITLARVLSLARKDEWSEVDNLMAEIDRQPSIGSFKSKILAIRVPAVAEAQRNRDRAAEQRIVAMCRELEELVDRYLDRTTVRDVAAEISELRKVSRPPAKSG